MTIELILTTMQQLQKMHESLLQLAVEKGEYLKEGDIEAIDELIKKEQSHIAAIAQLERNRLLAVEQYFSTQGQRLPRTATISDVIVSAEEQEKVALTEAKNRLLHTIHDLKWQNDLNQKLTYQSLQFVNLSLDMMRPEQTAINYSVNEIQGEQEKKKRSNFDSQA